MSNSRKIMTAAGLVGLFALTLAAPAHADATAFIGATTTPTNRPVRGFAVGVSLVIVGFEFEYSDTAEDQQELAPSLRTGMFNGLVQTPTRTQLYATLGGGLYRERLDTTQETHVGVNVGGGVKFPLAGPLRARVDYRLFTLRGEPLHPRVHRAYVGINLTF